MFATKAKKQNLTCCRMLLSRADCTVGAFDGPRVRLVNDR